MTKKPMFLRVLGPALVAGAIVLAGGVAAAATTCYSFSAVAGSSFSVGDSLSLATATINFKRFQWSNGVWTNTGSANVITSNNAAGTATQELNLNNIMVQVVPDTPAYAANYLYADLGGNVNFGVNGDFRNTADLIDLDGTVVGGCDISVTAIAIPGGVRGEVIITPQAGVEIEKFGVGGQEFFIDDVCFDY